MSNPIFNINYCRAYSLSVEFETQINSKAKGREQRYPIKTYPKRTFTLKFEKNPTVRAELEAFFESVYGAYGVFDWTWEESKGGNGKTYECYFDADSLNQNIKKLGYSECELKLVTIDTNTVTSHTDLDFYHKAECNFATEFLTLVDKVFTAQNSRRKYLDEPKRSWTLTFEKNTENRKLLEDFFISKRGRFKSFSFTWAIDKGGDGNTYTVRFDTDTLQSDIKALGYGSIQLPIKEVWATPAAATELEKDEIIPRKLLKLDISTGAVRILDNETLASLTYDSESYLGAPLELGDLTKDDNTEVQKVNVSVSNVNQAISGIIGQYGDVITNCDCYIYQVFLDTSTNAILSEYSQLVFFGKANNLNITDEQASIDIECQLGGYESKIPKMNYNTNCTYRKFKDCRCGYTGPEKTCDRTLTTCKRYGNIENFGGFPQMYKEMIIKA